MAISRLQVKTQKITGSFASPVVITLDQAPGDGSLLLLDVFLRTNSGIASVTSITQEGASWSLVQGIESTVVAFKNLRHELWMAPNTVSAVAAISIAVSHTGSNPLRGGFVVSEYAGLMASPLDKSTTYNGSVQAQSTGLTESTTAANELWYGSLGYGGGLPIPVSFGYRSLTNSFLITSDLLDYSGDFWVRQMTADAQVGATGQAGFTAIDYVRTTVSKIAAVGMSGMVQTSVDDGVTWVTQAATGSGPEGTSGVNLWKVRNNGSRWLLVGDHPYASTVTFWHSTHAVGYAWTPVDTGGAYWLDVAYSPGVPATLVACGVHSGSATDIERSTTSGGGWSMRTPAIDINLTGVACSNAGLWCVVGYNGSIQTSITGATWAAQAHGGVPTSFTSVAHNQVDLWVAVGTVGGIQTSPNGVDWTVRSSNGVTGTLNDVAYGNGMWMTVGENGTVRTSVNGEDWVAHTFPAPTMNIHGVVWTGSTWVLCGVGIYTSPTGDDWEYRTPGGFDPSTPDPPYSWPFLAIGAEPAAAPVAVTPDVSLGIVATFKERALYVDCAGESNSVSSSSGAIFGIELVQRTHAQMNAGQATATITLATAPQDRSLLVLALSYEYSNWGESFHVAQTGAEWHQITVSDNYPNVRLLLWYAYNVQGASAEIVVTSDEYSRAQRNPIVVAEYKGFGSLDPLDAFAAAQGLSSGATTGTTVTTAKAKELCIGAIADVEQFAGNTPTQTPTNGFETYQFVTDGGVTYEMNLSLLAKTVNYVWQAVATVGLYTGGILTAARWCGAIATFAEYDFLIDMEGLSNSASTAEGGAQLTMDVSSLSQEVSSAEGAASVYLDSSGESNSESTSWCSPDSVHNLWAILGVHTFGVYTGYTGLPYHLEGPADYDDALLGLERLDRVLLSGSGVNSGLLLTLDNLQGLVVLEAIPHYDSDASVYRPLVYTKRSS